jgi:hypothetical protein
MEDDMPTRLVPVPRHDPAIERRERSWTLIAGSHRLSFTRIDHRIASRPRTIVAVAPLRRWSLTGMIAVGLGSTVAMATLGLALNASRAATGGGYVLRVSVPAAIPRKAVVSAPKAKSVSRRSATTPIAVVVPTPAAAEATMAVDDIVPAEASAITATTVQPAIAAAARTGMLQQWASADGVERGFVVAGPAEQGCRTLSILTRRDGGNEVRTQRECTPLSNQAAP